MRRVEGRWRDVQVEDFVKDLNGKMWRVDRWDMVVATLTDKDGKQTKVRPDPHSTVTYYKRTMADAVRLVEKRLGGVVIEEIRTEA